MPSRIKTLLHELLQVLLSIIRPQSTSTSTVQGNNVSLQQRLQQHHEQAQQLRAVLDADLIEQEMKHGLYEPSSTFRVIGEVLKAHCAPMRDQAVDRMVALAIKCRPEGGGTKADAVEVMRQCFEILELMKLVRDPHASLRLLDLTPSSLGHREPPDADPPPVHHPLLPRIRAPHVQGAPRPWRESSAAHPPMAHPGPPTPRRLAV